MSIIPDNTGRQCDRLESWAVQHMAREVWFEADKREQICRRCLRHRENGGGIFVRCEDHDISLAGDKCPDGKW